MSLSMRAEPVAPQAIAGGFILVPVHQLLFAWRSCRRSPLGIGDFRTWLACHEILARRCTLDKGRSPTYGHAELARLTGVSEKRARSSVNRLVEAGLLTWSDQLIEFSEAETDPDDALDDTIGGGKGSLAIPRRILRLLVDGARPALIATVLAILLRCLSRSRVGFKSRGRVKASWIARVFGVDLRRVKQARRELIDLGWIVPEPTDQWAENSWGRVYHINLAWDRIATPEGRQLPPHPPADGRRLPLPDSDPEPLREEKNQEPASSGLAGFQINEGTEEQKPQSPSPMPWRVLAPAIPMEATVNHVPSVVVKIEPACSPPVPVVDGAPTSAARVESGRPVPTRPTAVTNGAGGTPLPAPRLDDVRIEDLKDIGRLLVLLAQAIARDLLGTSEADRLRFVAAAEHAMAVGSENPPGLFMYLVRGRLWRYLTQEDENRANARIKRELHGEPPSRPGAGLLGSRGRPLLSADAELVREVRAAMIRARIFCDPFAAFQRLNPDWTRGRWDAAIKELERDQLMA